MNTNGIRWEIKDAPMFGAKNGYITLPEGHPWRNLTYQEINSIVWSENLDAGLVGGARELTYKKDSKIGFDTLHAWDYWPTQPFSKYPDQTEWTAELVAEQAKVWAKIIAMTRKEEA